MHQRFIALTLFMKRVTIDMGLRKHYGIRSNEISLIHCSFLTNTKLPIMTLQGVLSNDKTFSVTTRMHSSRMPTVRSSGRSWGGGGVVSACQGDVCLPGCLPREWGVCLPGGVCLPYTRRGHNDRHV